MKCSVCNTEMEEKVDSTCRRGRGGGYQCPSCLMITLHDGIDKADLDKCKKRLKEVMEAEQDAKENIQKPNIDAAAQLSNEVRDSKSECKDTIAAMKKETTPKSIRQLKRSPFCDVS